MDRLMDPETSFANLTNKFRVITIREDSPPFVCCYRARNYIGGFRQF